MWSANLRTGEQLRAFQIISLLSLPPEQSCCSSGDHLSPQTSCRWPSSLPTKAEPQRTSRCRMVLSREPVERREELQEMEPTRLEWPCSTRTRLTLLMSQRCTSPLLVPRQKEGPFAAHPTDVTVSDSPRSHSLVTFELSPFQRQTLEARPTARKFCCDQSMRLRQKSSWRAGASSTLKGILPILRFALMEATSSSVKSSALLSWKGSLGPSASCCPNLKRLLFWKSSMGLSDLMLRPGSLMMHFRQISERLSEHGSAGEGALFSPPAFSSGCCAMRSARSCRRVGMKRSVTTLRSPSSPSASMQFSKESTTISRSLDSVLQLATDFPEAAALPVADYGLPAQQSPGKQRLEGKAERESMWIIRPAMFSNRNYNPALPICVQKEQQIKLIQYLQTHAQSRPDKVNKRALERGPFLLGKASLSN